MTTLGHNGAVPRLSSLSNISCLLGSPCHLPLHSLFGSWPEGITPNPSHTVTLATLLSPCLRAGGPTQSSPSDLPTHTSLHLPLQPHQPPQSPPIQPHSCPRTLAHAAPSVWITVPQVFCFLPSHKFQFRPMTILCHPYFVPLHPITPFSFLRSIHHHPTL